jgi:hypothetical protein
VLQGFAVSGGLRAPNRRDFGLCLPKLFEQSKRKARLALVDPTHGETDMHENPSAEAARHRMVRVYDTREVDFTLHATDIDYAELAGGVGDRDDLARYS